MTLLEIMEIVRLITLIVVILFSLILGGITLVGIRREGLTRKRVTSFIVVLGVIFVTYLVYSIREIGAADWAQIMLLLALVMVTGFYAWSASRQADASVEMTEEMKEQRVMVSRPVIIQKAVVETETKLRTFSSRDWFSHFEVYNAGNGPAIEVEISLLNKEKTPVHSQRKTFLRADEPPVEFGPDELVGLEKTNYYLVCEYQGILSHNTQPVWYQTWLPFETIKASEAGKIYVKPGELEFKEVDERERIDAFGSRSKPK